MINLDKLQKIEEIVKIKPQSYSEYKINTNEYVFGKTQTFTYTPTATTTSTGNYDYVTWSGNHLETQGKYENDWNTYTGSNAAGTVMWEQVSNDVILDQSTSTFSLPINSTASTLNWADAHAKYAA